MALASECSSELRCLTFPFLCRKRSRASPARPLLHTHTTRARCLQMEMQISEAILSSFRHFCWYCFRVATLFFNSGRNVLLPFCLTRKVSREHRAFHAAPILLLLFFLGPPLLSSPLAPLFYVTPLSLPPSRCPSSAFHLLFPQSANLSLGTNPIGRAKEQEWAVRQGGGLVDHMGWTWNC